MPARKTTGIPSELLDQLLGGAEAKTAFEKDGLFDELKKALAERALNAELGRHDVEPLGAVFADQVQRACAAGAGLVLHIDHSLAPGQMLGQRATVRPPPRGGGGLALWMAGFLAGGLGRRLLLDLFQRQLQLVQRQGLGPAAEAVTLHLLDDLAQPLGLGGMGGALGQDQRLKRFDILRQSIGQTRHG